MIRKLRERMNEQAGFTLIELLLVVVVLGILAGIAVPRIGGVRDQADESAAKSNLRAMQSALEMYYVSSEDGEYPENDQSLASEFISGDLVSLFENDGNPNYKYDSTDGSDYTISYKDGGDDELNITHDSGASWTQ